MGLISQKHRVPSAGMRYMPRFAPPGVLGGSGTPDVVPVAMAISQPQFGLAPGMTTQLSAVATDVNGVVVSGTPQWSTSDSNVLVVDSDGLVTAVGYGDAQITCSVLGYSRNSLSSVGDYQFYRGAELPRVVPSMPNITWDNVLFVSSDGSDLYTKLTQAATMAGNTAVVVPNGATYVWGASRRLPQKSGAANGWWVGIMSESYYNNTFPAKVENRRFNKSTDLAHTAKIEFSSADGIRTDYSANGKDCNRYMLLGMELAPENPLGTIHFGLLNLGSGSDSQTDPTDVPHHFVVRHCYFHSYPTVDCKRGINNNGGWCYVGDSYFEDIGVLGNGDSGDIAGWNGTGPYCYDNNYFGGIGINIFYGGATCEIETMVSDITITRNLIEKPLRYNIHDDANYGGIKKSCKNLLEIKHGIRWHIRGNILRNCWRDGQTGPGMLIKTVNQYGDPGTYETGHVVIRYNKVLNTVTPLNTSERETYASSPSTKDLVPVHHLVIEDNVFQTGDITKLGVTSGHRSLYFGAAAPAMKTYRYPWGPGYVAHNTFTKTPEQKLNAVVLLAAKEKKYDGNMVWEFNIFDHDAGYGIAFDQVGSNAGMLAYAEIAARYNVWGKKTTWLTQAAFNAEPTLPGNVVLNLRDDIGMVDRAGGNYRLAPTSAYKGWCPDGRDPGADIDAVEYETRGCITGVWE